MPAEALHSELINIKNMIISTTKSSVVIREIKTVDLIKFNEDVFTDASLKVEIYFSVRPLVSVVLSYIVSQFGSFSQTDPSQALPHPHSVS